MAVVSDIHGSLAALDAVIAALKQDGPDLVVHGGDTALSGPRPAEVIDRIRDLKWPGVVGNTDELLWSPEELPVQEARAPRHRKLLRILFQMFAPVTRALLGQDRLDWLRQLPQEWRSETNIVVLHASPGDLWRAPMPDVSDSELMEVYGGQRATLVVYGHIHRAYVRILPRITVGNSGSVGLPYDGDWRASYLLIDDGSALVKRIAYPLERDIADLRSIDYPCATWLAEIRRQGAYLAPPASELPI